jgi:hypothetical protein
MIIDHRTARIRTPGFSAAAAIAPTVRAHRGVAGSPAGKSVVAALPPRNRWPGDSGDGGGVSSGGTAPDPASCADQCNQSYNACLFSAGWLMPFGLGIYMCNSMHDQCLQGCIVITPAPIGVLQIP